MLNSIGVLPFTSQAAVSAIERDHGEKRMTKKILVVGAHSADFVWRAAGTIATIVSQGGERQCGCPLVW
jgi:hypothetical protein